MRPYNKNDPDSRWCRRWRSGCDKRTCRCARSPHTSSSGDMGAETFSDVPYLASMRDDFSPDGMAVVGYRLRSSKRSWEFLIHPDDWDYLDGRGL